MTLRARLAILTSAAMALAVLAASVAAWLLIRSSLLDEIDQRLLDRLPDIDQLAEMSEQMAEQSADGTGGPSLVIANDPLGVQIVSPDGAVEENIPPGEEIEAFVLDGAERALLEGETEGPHMRTESIEGINYRVMSALISNGGVLRLVQPLDGVEGTMTRIAWLLVAVAGVGVAVAGALGWVIARAGLRRVDKLVAAAEQVATTKDLAHRIEVRGSDRDEVVRLAGSVNAMLAALDSARSRQRQLVEDAGHELRTPLTTLRNDLGVLLRAEQRPERTLAGADRSELLRDLESEAAALSEMIGEIVDLARGGTDDEPYLEVDLGSLADRAVARTRRVNPDVAVDVRGGPIEATVRPATLERAIANLVRNAVQVSPAGGRVEVLLRARDGWATVRVLDRGPGVRDDDLPRLFDRFYRGADARERQGSGLGLAIVAQAVELHGGTVAAARRPGGGSVFTLRVPLRAPVVAG
ncbi:HAMP domain-containing sensor histidine kinase [Jiangella asiatica]|uniref:histidine kinase n=1 Tax=Jiangella asiatica TaxID=2530372 RepID=A0A4V2YZA0_9ACTN|nr:HAMP domain-containing sensor histidine kinase [Jiangella asiatica]TDD96297.1 HAMP domain-containing histidine kinase [Jiangella asiatica]